MKKKPKRSGEIVHDIAPGEKKKLTHWIREENHDIKAWPELFPDGLNGFHDPNRIRKISANQNFNHKIYSKNKKFAQDADFIFAAQQYLERHAFENQVTISFQRGIPIKGTDGKIKNNDAIDVFKKIPGTPSYWKLFRNEIFARMEQLGPFTFFFTLSSAEMRWPEVILSILHTNEEVKNISYNPGWEEDENNIIIHYEDKDMPLPEYKEKYISRNKSQFFKDHFLLITRIFDNKVKAFIKLLTANGEVGYYSYRIEFQLRGMPHVHGVFWLRHDLIKPFLDDKNEYKDDDIDELVDKWVSCSLDTGDDKLNQLVQEVNVHRHTKSCKKGKMNCRFHFPKLPSIKTIIAGMLLRFYT